MDAGRLDEAWGRLSPAYQARTGRSSYEGFWRTIRSVQVLDVREGERSAVATLRYVRTDGTTSTEAAYLGFVEDRRTGALLIDQFRAA